MNKEIESIVNVTSYAILDATGAWSTTVALPQADECVIRQIAYECVASKGIYLIWSNIRNDFIGSFCTLGAMTSPNTRIQLTGPVPGTLMFQLMHPSSSPLPATDANTDSVVINMDFIKYRK